jgi:hypothetical protein
VFGEYSFDRDETLAAVLLAINAIMIVVSLAAMVYVMVRCREVNMFARLGLFFIWLIQIVFFIIFNIKYPQVCTMDFRYMIPTVIVGAIYTGIALDHLKDKGSHAARWLFYIGCVMVGLFQRLPCFSIRFKLGMLIDEAFYGHSLQNSRKTLS